MIDSRFALAGLSSLLLGPLAVAQDADRYRMKLRLDVEAGALEGTVRLHYHNDAGTTLREIRLRLDANLDQSGAMEIRSAKDAQGGDLKWRHVPFTWGKKSSKHAHMAVALPEPLAAGDAVELSLEFRFAHSRAISAEIIALQDDPYPSFDAWYPKAMSFRAGAWSIDDDRRSSFEVILDAPAALPLATTGSLVEERPGKAGRVVRTLRAERVRGFTFYGMPSWKVHRRKADGVEIRCFLEEEHAEWAPKLLDATVDSIAYYRKLFGSYPTKHLDLITIWAERGGGAFACCNVMGIFLGRGVEQRYRWLVAHEVAHQYFGNVVNQTRHELYWVIIGLGMVLDRGYLLDRGLGDKMHRQMLSMYRRAKKQNHNTTLSQTSAQLLATKPPWSYQWNLVLAHAKAYSVCSMLEDLVGKERFIKVVRNLLESKAGSLINADDLVKRCEKATGEDLDWFVADWIDGDVSLDYALGKVERKAGLWQVEVTRLGEASYPVVVEAETESGKKLRARVARDRKVDVLEFATDEELVSVTVDPEGIYPDLVPHNNRWTK